MYHRGHEQHRKPSHSQGPPVSPVDQPPASPHEQQQQQSQPTLSQRRTARNPALDAKLSQLALPLAPLVQLTTGRVHPSFPATLLGFWLLTDAELESLAHFYHQRTPSHLTRLYPCPVEWGSALPLEEKRRKLGRFIGLRGCESPVLSAEEMVERARRRVAEEDDGDEALRRKWGFWQ